MGERPAARLSSTQASCRCVGGPVSCSFRPFLLARRAQPRMLVRVWCVATLARAKRTREQRAESSQLQRTRLRKRSGRVGSGREEARAAMGRDGDARYLPKRASLPRFRRPRLEPSRPPARDRSKRGRMRDHRLHSDEPHRAANRGALLGGEPTLDVARAQASSPRRGAWSKSSGSARPGEGVFLGFRRRITWGGANQHGRRAGGLHSRKDGLGCAPIRRVPIV